MTHPMVELAVHIKLATAAVVDAAEHLATLSLDGADARAAAVCAHVMDELIALNVQLGLMERILHLATQRSAPALGIL